MSPVVVFRWHDRYELIDGFKRGAAARAVSSGAIEPIRIECPRGLNFLTIV
jgi:hypothetical protein